MFRVLTVAREYGSGGGCIARAISERLGWELLDKELVFEIARAMRVQPELVRQFDEKVDSWLHRLSRRSLCRGAFEGVAAVTREDLLDAETTAALAGRLIEASYARGNCVIVGRGAQCLLQNRPDALHVFIYAPLRQRIARAQSRVPGGCDVEEYIRSVDRRRAEYIRFHYGCDWTNPHLYHMLISSELGDEPVASIITQAVLSGGARTT